jgi:hypothetical protein
VPRWEIPFYATVSLIMVGLGVHALLDGRHLAAGMLGLLAVWFALRGVTFYRLWRFGRAAVPAALRWGQRGVLLAAVVLLVMHLTA